jgi:hypothetical protein
MKSRERRETGEQDLFRSRLDQNPQAMRVRRETVEGPFATLKMRLGATHFLKDEKLRRRRVRTY